MSTDPKAIILRCKYCWHLTVEMGGMAQCPKGCPGHFSVMPGPIIFIPREGVYAALALAKQEPP